MSTNANLIHAIADALIEAHGQNAAELLECGGRAGIERGVAGWCAEIAEDAWLKSARGCPRSPGAPAHRRTRGRRAHGRPRPRARQRGLERTAAGRDGAHWVGLCARAPSRRHGRAFRVHRVRVSRARRGGMGRGRRAAVERGAGALRRRGPRRSVPRRGAVRRAPSPVPRPAGTVAPGDGGRGRRARVGVSRRRRGKNGRRPTPGLGRAASPTAAPPSFRSAHAGSPGD